MADEKSGRNGADLIENGGITTLGYRIGNPEKLNRAVFGTVARSGILAGGVGESATELQVLAEYDRLGGAIWKGKYKVRDGSFYDFKNRKPRAKPEVFLTFRDLEGNRVEIGEEEDVPLELQAAQMIADKKAKKNVEGAVTEEKKTKKKAKVADDADEE